MESFKFRPDSSLFEARAALHDFIDILWRHGEYTRPEVYRILGSVTGRPDAHVSRMDRNDIISAAAGFTDMLKPYADCRNCGMLSGRTLIGVPVCGMTGEPFYRSVYGSFRSLPRKCNGVRNPNPMCADKVAQVK